MRRTMNVFAKVNETLFEQIARLEGVDRGNPDTMELEISRAKSIRELAGAVIDNNRLILEAAKAGTACGEAVRIPKGMLDA